MEDTREELERLEQELLAEEQLSNEEQMLEELIQEVKSEEASDDIFLDEELLREVLSEDATPAFEDPEKIHEPEELVYSNFANDYGKDLQKEDETADEEQSKKAAEDKLQIILMIAASALSLGIIAILIYWLVAFF